LRAQVSLDLASRVQQRWQNLAAQASQVCVRNVFRKYDHDQIAANLFD